MTPNVRIFASEDGALAADKRLEKNGFKIRTVILARDSAGREDEVVRAAVAAGTLPVAHARICARSLRDGHSLVAVRAPYGFAEEALILMERGDVVHADNMRRHRSDDPSPFSDVFGLPVLTPFHASTNLIPSDHYSTGAFGLLVKAAAPLSSMFGLPTVIRQRKPWRTSFGFPLLSHTAAPFSNLFGLKTVVRPEPSWRYHRPPPDNPAPFSNLFHLKVLFTGRREQA